MPVRIDEGPLADRKRKGPALYYTTATPDGEAKAVLGLIHGYADHGARYLHVMGALAELGIAVVALDMRGHGRAAGERGYCDRFDEYFDDLDELPPLLQKTAAGVPQVLLGHSFGGLAVTSYLLERGVGDYRGVVLSAPFFGLALEVPKVKVWAGDIASRIYPKLGIPSGLAGSDLTHDPVRARGYDEDPLVFKKARARWFTEAKAAQARVLRDAAKLALPTYMIFGEDDRVASFKAGKEVFGRFGSADKTFVPLPGLFHEVLNEPSWKDTTEGVAAFVIRVASAR